MHLSCFVTLEKRWARKKREGEGGEWGIVRLECRTKIEGKTGYFKISLKLHATNFICLSMFVGV